MPPKAEKATSTPTREEVADHISDLADSMQNALDGILSMENTIRSGGTIEPHEADLLAKTDRYIQQYRRLVPKIIGLHR